MLREFLDELRGAWQGLGRAPAFAALAVAVLSLGLGAVVFMYGVVDAMLLRPPPLPAAERLYAIHGRDRGDGHLRDSIGLHDYAAIRAAGLPVEALGAAYNGTVYLTGDGPASRHDGAFVTASLFELLGVEPALGRLIGAADERPGAVPAVVLGDALWRDRYGADAGVLGRRVELNGREAEIVGVMPPGFAFPMRQELWLTSQQDPASTPARAAVEVAVYARLAPGATPADLDAALVPVAQWLAAANPGESRFSSFEATTLGAGWVGEVGRDLLWTLLAAVGIVLLIACANVSNLLLSRAAWRMRETSLRAALGAARSRLVLQVLAESTLVTVSAAAVGLLLAAMALDGMQRMMAATAEYLPYWMEFHISVPVSVFALGATVATMLLAGVPAALRATRPSLDAMLRDGGRGGTGPAIGRVAAALVVAEVALATAVLGGSALMTRSVLLITQADLGVDVREFATARFGLPAGRLDDPAAQAELFARYVERLQAEPAVRAAGLMQFLPGLGFKRTALVVEDRPQAAGSEPPTAGVQSMSASTFATLRLAPVAGRLFDARDGHGAAPVAVVNEAFVRRFMGGESPLGHRVRGEQADDPWRTIVGVVPDVVHDVHLPRAEPALYLSLSQAPERFVSVIARGDGDPEPLYAAMRRALADTDDGLAIYWERTLPEAIGLRTSGMRIIGGMLLIFAVIALVLAAAGLFGVLSFHVSQRTREIGVRRALGADDGRILALVARVTGTQVAIGLALGLATVPLVRDGLVRSLPELHPGSAWAYIGVPLVMLAVAVAAVARPTWRALRVDPAAALRYE